MRIDNKTLENQIMFELLFSEYVKIPKENDYGEWYYFEYKNHNYFVQFIDSITEIKILPLSKKYNFIFVEKETLNTYAIIDGFIKKDIIFKSIWKIKGVSDHLVLDKMRLPLKLSETGLKSILNRIRYLYLLEQFNPLQVKIMLLQGKVYLLYSESKMADKNNRYSIKKDIIKKDFFTVHFILNSKEDNGIFNKENILRANIIREDIRLYNNLCYVDKSKYKKIKS